jgi:hypothetical protein
MRKFYLAFITLFFLFSTGAQQRSLWSGGKLINNWTFYNGSAVGFGGQLIYKMTKHSGLETGLYYYNRPRDYTTTIYYGNTMSTYDFGVNERRLLMPVFYRFDSKFLNFSVGPVLDYFVGWKQTDGLVEVNSYSNSAIQVTGSAGVSKSFYLNPTLILEPEVMFNYIFAEDDGAIGLNLSLRKKIF